MQHMTHDDRYKKSGLTVALGGALADSITNATRTIKQAGGRDDKRLTALELNEARKQLQDGYEAVDSALHGAKIRDAVTGKVEKVNGKAKRGPKNIDDAVNLSVSIGSTSQKQGQTVDTATYKGGTIISDGDVHLTARDAKKNGITLTGESVSAESISLASASDINIEAGKNTVDVKNDYKSSGWSAGASISLTGGGLLDINASGYMARQNGDTHQESYVPTKIKAAELAQLKAKRDTNIIGSTVSGKKVEVDTGRDLHIQSLQDVDNFKEHSKSAGFSVSSKPNFKDPTGSINASVGRIDSKWKSVTEQAGIYAGEDGYDINVGNSTTLEGALIKSNAPKTKNKLTTKSLEMKDIKNEAEYTYSNNGIGYNYYGSKKKLEEMKTNDKKGYDKIYNNIGLVPNLGVGSKGKASSTTQSAISDGILTVDGKEIDTKTINTNTENTLHQLDKIFDKKKIEERQELARLFSKNAFEQLHNWQPTTKDGKAAKSIAHGIIGELAARIAGNTPGSGFKATMTNEMLIDEIRKLAKDNSDLAQWLSAGLGALVNFSTDSDSNLGAAVASYGTKWNEVSVSHVERSNETFLNEKDAEARAYRVNSDVSYKEVSDSLNLVKEFGPVGVGVDFRDVTPEFFRSLAEAANKTNPFKENGAFLMMNLNSDYINQLNYKDKGFKLLSPRKYEFVANSQLGSVIMQGIEMQKAIKDTIEFAVNNGTAGKTINIKTNISYSRSSNSEKLLDLFPFVSAGRHEFNSEAEIDSRKKIYTNSLLVDNSNYEYHKGTAPSDILNNIGARGMELGHLTPYEWMIKFKLEAVPVEMLRLEEMEKRDEIRIIGDRIIRKAPSIALIKSAVEKSGSEIPSKNSLVDIINEQLNSGGRLITIYDAKKEKNVNYIVWVKNG